MRTLRWAMFAAALAGAGPALAHTSERGQVMLLPTGLYIAGGALAVAASVLLVALLPVLPRKPMEVSVSLFRLMPLRRAAPSVAGLAVVGVLIAAGLWGPFDPISNPLPGAVWTVWWIGLAVVTAVAGNIWAAINPWSGLHMLVGIGPFWTLPRWLGQWPAVALFLAFAWFELVYPTPQDPTRLAMLMLGYVLFTFAGVFAFGEPWFRQAECFSVFFRMVARLAPVQWSEDGGALRLTLVPPGAALLSAEANPPGASSFILLALATVSFDGFMRTFFWLDRIGVNPLEFPGRSQVMVANTLGLLAMFAVLALAYRVALWLGEALGGSNLPMGLVWSVTPIALAYHLAHYLPELPVGLMEWAKAVSDPFGTGLDLFGTAEIHPPASIMMDHAVAAFVYRLQTGIIVLGHVIAVAVAHLIALREAGTRATLVGLAPLNILMIAYTVFGLWLLATPVAG